MLPAFYRSHYTAEYSRTEEKVEDLALHPNMNYAAGPCRHEAVYPFRSLTHTEQVYLTFAPAGPCLQTVRGDF